MGKNSIFDQVKDWPAFAKDCKYDENTAAAADAAKQKSEGKVGKEILDSTPYKHESSLCRALTRTTGLQKPGSHMRWHLRLLGIALCVFSTLRPCLSADAPDPVALLRGVEAARLQIPPSRILLRGEYRSAFAQNQNTFWILFERERRLFVRTNDPPVPDASRMLYTGSEVLKYDGNKFLAIRNLDSLTADYFFDPRLLGIMTIYAWGETVSTSVPYRRASKVEMVGREDVEGRSAWHVRVFDLRRQLDLWIDDKNGFRVYRYDQRVPGVSDETARSYYENPNYSWIPSRVEGEDRSTNGSVRVKRKFEILQAEAEVPIPPNMWTMAGINPPRETQVVDVRSMTDLGYWDGKRVVAGPPSNINLQPPGWSRNRIFTLVALIMVLALPLALFLSFILPKDSKRPGD